MRETTAILRQRGPTECEAPVRHHAREALVSQPPGETKPYARTLDVSFAPARRSQMTRLALRRPGQPATAFRAGRSVLKRSGEGVVAAYVEDVAGVA